MTFILSSASAADPVYLKYESEYSTLHIWDGDCDPSFCTVTDPCLFDGTELLQLNFSGPCTYQLTSASDTFPVMKLNASRLDPGVNVTFLVENGFDLWYSLDIYQYRAVIVFSSASTIIRSSMGGTGTIYMDPYLTSNFSASPAGLIFDNLLLKDLSFTYASTAYEIDRTPTDTRVPITMLVNLCYVSASATASKPWFALDTSTTPPFSRSFPAVAPSLIVQDSTLEMNFETTASAFLIHTPTTTSETDATTATSIDMIATSITGTAKDLVRRIGEGPATGSMVWSLTNSTINATRLYSLYTDASDGSTTFYVTGSTLNILPPLNTNSSLTFAAADAYSIAIGATSSYLSGLSFLNTFLFSTDTKFTNCFMAIGGAQMKGHNTIQFSSSLPPLAQDYAGAYSATFTGGTINMNDALTTDTTLSLLKADNSNASFKFSGTVTVPMTSNSIFGCGVYLDSSMNFDAGATFNTQCNLTVAGPLVSLDGTPSTVTATHRASIPSTLLTTPVLDIGPVLINTRLNLSGFAMAVLDASLLTPSTPLLATLGSSSIIGYPYRGISVDFASGGLEPVEGTVYQAFVTNMASITSSHTTPFTDASIATSPTASIPLAFNIDSAVSNVWNVTFQRASPPAPAPIASCPPPPPGFICVAGTWVSSGTIDQPTTTITITTSSVVVTGNFSVESLIFTGTQHNVTVSGCITLGSNGSVSIDLSTEDPKRLSGKTIAFLTQQGSNCSTSLSMVPVSIKQPKNNCATVESKVAPTSSHDTLALVFSIDRSSCNTKWIILGSVLGVLAIVAVVGIGVAYVLIQKKKYKDGHKSLTNQ